MKYHFDEYILKPYWIDLHHLASVSEYFNKFSNKYNLGLNCEAINLDLLRNFYSVNKQRTIDLIDEFVLRGFKFVANKQSALLPTLILNDPIECILSQVSSSSFNNINFSALGLGDLVERFCIQTNGFFDGTNRVILLF
jgi:hypothetical protein